MEESKKSKSKRKGKGKDSMTMMKKKKKKKTTEVEMDFVGFEEGSGCPYVAYFPSGYGPLDHQGGDCEVRGYQNLERYRGRQQQLVLQGAPSSPVDFVGSNSTGEAALWHPGNYALGVFRKDANSLTLIPLAGGKVFRMEPKVRGVDYGELIAEEPVLEPMSNELMLQKKGLLTSTFGSKKSRIKMHSRERGIVKTEALGEQSEMDAYLEEARKNQDMPSREEALDAVNASIARNIPPHDPHATSPQNVYKLDKMVSADEFESLKEEAEFIISIALDPSRMQELTETGLYPKYLLNRLHRLTTEDQEENTRSASILIYIRHLLAFYHLPRHLLKSVVDPMECNGEDNDRTIDLRSYSSIPHAVVARLLKLFTSVVYDTGGKTVRVQTQEKKNLLISYILVLGLITDGFQADPYDLAVELKMTVLTLKPHYLQLGCKFSTLKASEKEGGGPTLNPNTAQKNYKVALPTPLTFPVLKAKRMRQ